MLPFTWQAAEDKGLRVEEEGWVKYNALHTPTLNLSWPANENVELRCPVGESGESTAGYRCICAQLPCDVKPPLRESYLLSRTP